MATQKVVGPSGHAALGDPGVASNPIRELDSSQLVEDIWQHLSGRQVEFLQKSSKSRVAVQVL